MRVEEITSSLKQRGAIWQAAGFAAVGTASVAMLWVYSDSDHWIAGSYRLAATQVNWAYFGIIALSIEGVRIVFEKATEIRRRYSEQADARAMEKGLVRGRAEGREEGRNEGEREALARVRSEMLKRGIELSKEDEEAIFNPNGHSR